MIAIIVLLVVGFFVYRYVTSYESTDDAQVDGHINSISARISGHVVKLNVQDNQYVQAGTGTVDVTRRRVQIVVNVEIYDQKHGKSLWKQSGLTVDGEYQPPAETKGRELALQKLVTQVVEGAQSQW